MSTAYLYAIDILPEDGDLSNHHFAQATLSRRVHLLTNYERPISFPHVSAFWSSFLAQPAHSDLVDGLPVFQPVAGISHSGVRLNSEKSSGDLTLTLPLNHPVAQLFAYDAPSAQLWLTVYAMSADGTAAVQWVGRIHSCEYEAPVARLKCSHFDQVLARPGLTRKHPRSCAHALYSPSPGCGINRNEKEVGTYFRYREDGFISEVRNGGLTLIVPEAANQPDGWFTEGFIAIEPTYYSGGASGNLPRHQPRATIPNPTGGRDDALSGGFRRHITSHIGSELRLSASLLAPLPGRPRVSVWAGCTLTSASCKDKFNNFARFGGYPWIPLQNAFEAGIKE